MKYDKNDKNAQKHEPCRDALPFDHVEQILKWNRTNGNTGKNCIVCENIGLIPYEKQDTIYHAKCPYCVKFNHYTNPDEMESKIEDTKERYWRGFCEGWILWHGAGEVLRKKTTKEQYPIFFVGLKPSNECLFYHRMRLIGGIGFFQVKWNPASGDTYAETFNDYSLRKLHRIWPGSAEATARYREITDTIKCREETEEDALYNQF